jgi:hypothetical protein
MGLWLLIFNASQQNRPDDFPEIRCVGLGEAVETVCPKPVGDEED